jgi:hypothetical protein
MICHNLLGIDSFIVGCYVLITIQVPYSILCTLHSVPCASWRPNTTRARLATVVLATIVDNFKSDYSAIKLINTEFEPYFGKRHPSEINKRGLQS